VSPIVFETSLEIKGVNKDILALFQANLKEKLAQTIDGISSVEDIQSITFKEVDSTSVKVTFNLHTYLRTLSETYSSTLNRTKGLTLITEEIRHSITNGTLLAQIKEYPRFKSATIDSNQKVFFKSDLFPTLNPTLSPTTTSSSSSWSVGLIFGLLGGILFLGVPLWYLFRLYIQRRRLRSKKSPFSRVVPEEQEELLSQKNSTLIVPEEQEELLKNSTLKSTFVTRMEP